MPELPEVETVVRQLQSLVVGKEVSTVEVHDSKVVDPSLQEIVPFTIVNVRRHGKWIVFTLNDEMSILGHLRMTGHFHFGSYEKYLAGVFHFSDDTFLTHNSIRRFGGLQLLSQEELDVKLSSLGFEPLDVDEKQFVSTFVKYPRANVKNKLLDQTFIAGVGNIYAQEALYRARIDPRKKVEDVPVRKLKKLCVELQNVLKLAIHNNGTTVDNYSNLTGKGSFQGMLMVYKQESCPMGHSLSKVKLGGRGTMFCGVCQI